MSRLFNLLTYAFLQFLFFGLSNSTQVPLAFQNDSEVLFSVAYFRHGARSPNKYIWDTFTPFSEMGATGKGQLTNSGRVQMYHLGEFYAWLFRAKLRQNIPLESGEFFSSNRSRVHESALYFLRGFYGLPVSMPETPLILVKNRFFDEFWTQRQARNTSNGDVQENLGKENDMDVQKRLETAPADHDYLFNADDLCPNYEEAFVPILNGPKGQEIVKEMVGEDQLRLVTEHFGRYLEPTGIKLIDIKRVIDTWGCSTAHGVPFPEGFDIEVFQNVKSWIFYELRFGNEELRQMQNSLFFLKVWSLIKDIEKNHEKNDESNPSKFLGFFGHDTNLAGILADLANIETIRKRKDKGIIPFAGDLSLFFSRKTGQNEKIFVEMVYLGEILEIKACGNAKQCPLEQFMEILKGKINFKGLDECKREKRIDL